VKAQFIKGFQLFGSKDEMRRTESAEACSPESHSFRQFYGLTSRCQAVRRESLPFVVARSVKLSGAGAVILPSEKTGVRDDENLCGSVVGWYANQRGLMAVSCGRGGVGWPSRF